LQVVTAGSKLLVENLINCFQLLLQILINQIIRYVIGLIRSPVNWRWRRKAANVGLLSNNTNRLIKNNTGCLVGAQINTDSWSVMF